MKQQFICVQPRSSVAEDRFVNSMDSLHSCKIIKEDDMKYVLSSITRRYDFEMRKGYDKNWEVIK